MFQFKEHASTGTENDYFDCHEEVIRSAILEDNRSLLIVDGLPQNYQEEINTMALLMSTHTYTHTSNQIEINAY